MSEQAIRIYICDDDEGVVARLASMLEAECRCEIKAFSDVSELLQILAAGAAVPDLLFLDIVFGHRTGIVAANEVHALYPQIPIVFMTGHLEYAPEIFEAEPLYLLHKPIETDRLQKAMAAAARYRAEQSDPAKSLMIKTKQGMMWLPYKSIEYIESNGRLLTANGTRAPVQFYGKMNSLEKQLPVQFLRAHQSFLVNSDCIEEIRLNEVILCSGNVVPISQKRRKNFLEGVARRQCERLETNLKNMREFF